jgi:hypothetical protein
MTALSANRPVSQAEGLYASAPMAASQTIYDGSMVGENGSGYARPLTAGDKFLGHAVEYRVSSTLAGEYNILLLSGRYRLEAALAGVAVTDIGRRVYASDDGTLTFVASTNSYVGRVVRYVASGIAEVEFQTADSGAETELAYANIADSAAIGASSTSEADFNKSVTIPLEKIKVGDVLRVTGVIQHTGSQTGATLIAKVYFGTEAIALPAQTIGAQNDMILFTVEFIIRAIGASGKIEAMCLAHSKLSSTLAAVLCQTSGELSEAIEADITLKVSGTYNGSNANNTAVIKHFVVQHMHAAA